MPIKGKKEILTNLGCLDIDTTEKKYIIIEKK